MFHATEVYTAIFRFLTRHDLERFMLVCMVWNNVIQRYDALFALHAMTLVCTRPVHNVILSVGNSVVRCRWAQIGQRLLNCKITMVRMMIPSNSAPETFA